MSNYVYDRPWSEIGEDVTDQTQVAEAMKQAGANFIVEVVPAAFILEKDIRYYNAPNYNFIIRADTKDVLGICKGRFVPIQNYVLIDMVQPLIDKGSARLDTIGVFGNGEKVWMLIKLPEYSYEIISEDNIETYLLLINGNDGSTSVMMGILPFRINCTNQLPGISKSMIKFRHTESAEEMMAFFRLKINAQLKHIKSYTQTLKDLASKPVTEDQCLEYFKKVLDLKGELTTRSKNKLAELINMYHAGRAAIPGHWYGAFNAVTEYFSYEVGRSQETRLNSLWLGKNNETLHKALTLAKEMS